MNFNNIFFKLININNVEQQFEKLVQRKQKQRSIYFNNQ